MKIKIIEERVWFPTFDDLIGDLEVHFCGFNPNYGVSCECWQVDPTLRMSADAQLREIEKAEIYHGDHYNYDPADRWPEYWLP